MAKVEFFFDIKANRKLYVTLREVPKKNVRKIYAAIAYTQSGELLDICIKNKIPLEWWGLFDSQEATKFALAKRAISSHLVKFYPFAELFHPKVIYFEGYGIYVGSANMTKSALFS